MLGYQCVVVSELVEVYEGFGDREDNGRMVARGRACVYRGGMKVGVADLGYLGQIGFMVGVVCAYCSCSGGRELGCFFRYAQ